MRVNPTKKIYPLKNNQKERVVKNSLNFVNITDEEKVNKLIAAGFKCTKQTISNKQIYSFLNTPELTSYLHSNFSSQEYFIDNKLRF